MYGVCSLLVVALMIVPHIRGQGDPDVQLAVIGESISNTSSVLGNSAEFYCEVIGAQTAVEELKFYKVRNNDPSDVLLLSTDSEVSVGLESKYSVSGKYRLNISDVSMDDEGEYRCTLGFSQYAGYLVVSDPPTSASMYWGDDRTWTPVNVAANLTCEAGLSRPPATFRWFRGNTEITALSVHPTVSVDSNGYGRGMSYIEITPMSNEEGVLYSCNVDVPGQDNVLVKTLGVSFSGAGHVIASVCLVFTSLLASTQA